MWRSALWASGRVRRAPRRVGWLTERRVAFRAACSCEVTGSGWVNLLLRSTWHTALEPALAAQASENLQEALDKVGTGAAELTF